MSTLNKVQTASAIVDGLADEALKCAQQAGATQDALGLTTGIAATNLVTAYLTIVAANTHMASPQQVAFALAPADGRLIEHTAAWACKHAFALYIAGRINRLLQEDGRNDEFCRMYVCTLVDDQKAKARALATLERAVEPYRRKAETACCKELRAVYSLNLDSQAP